MKRHIIPLALICALLLTGCGLSEQWDTVKEQYIDPAIERAEGVSAPGDDAIAAPNIATDRNELTELEPFLSVYSRESGLTITELVPSGSYGRLLPFGGGLVTVFVRGDAGYRAGVHMKEYGEHVPALIIGGRAGCFLGEYLAGGIIAVLNLQNSAQALGEEAARGMHGGRIYVRGGINVPLPDCVTARIADKEDMRVLVGYLKKFCAAFGGDAKKLAAEEFTLITPANKASKRLYAGN